MHTDSYTKTRTWSVASPGQEIPLASKNHMDHCTYLVLKINWITIVSVEMKCL